MGAFISTPKKQAKARAKPETPEKDDLRPEANTSPEELLLPPAENLAEPAEGTVALKDVPLPEDNRDKLCVWEVDEFSDVDVMSSLSLTSTSSVDDDICWMFGKWGPWTNKRPKLMASAMCLLPDSLTDADGSGSAKPAEKPTVTVCGSSANFKTRYWVCGGKQDADTPMPSTSGLKVVPLPPGTDSDSD